MLFKVIYILWIYSPPMLPWCLSGKEPTCRCRRLRFDSWVGKIPRRWKWYPLEIIHGNETGVGSPRGSSWPRNQTGISCIAVRFFTNWATREAQTRQKKQVERGRKGDKKKLKLKLRECYIGKKSREQAIQEREWVCCVYWCWKAV